MIKIRDNISRYKERIKEMKKKYPEKPSDLSECDYYDLLIENYVGTKCKYDPDKSAGVRTGIWLAPDDYACIREIIKEIKREVVK